MSLKSKILKNKVVFIFVGLFFVGLVYFYWLYKEPYTQNAFVVASIRPVTSFVPGYVTNVYVKNNSTIKKGDKLFDIFKDNYALSVDQLKAQVAEANSKSKAIKYQIEIAKYDVSKAQANYNNAKYLFEQAEWLYKENAVSQQDAERKYATMMESQQALNASQDQLNIQQENYNQILSQIEALNAQLGIAKLNLEWTTIYAQTDGYVTNMYLTPGTYLNPGDVVFAFIDSTTWWVQANFEETELALIKEGQKVSIKLWQYPDKVFEGVVTATGWGVSRTSSNQYGMPQVQQENEWFLLPQRFPVQIQILNVDESKYQLHPGGTAWVRVHIPALPIRQIFWQFFAI